MHSRMRSKYRPTINGKEVDLDLLYQIVTSHGGWEKVNIRNEWDDLLEHFHLPRGANGGFVIKQIYLKYLENYEKVYFLGEDAGNKDDMEDDYDDIRNRRRTASKFTSRSSYSQSPFPGSASQQQSQPQHNNVPLTDSMREQLGLSTRQYSDYERLLLSLKSPLPNEQDMAISVCTLLSNETKHVLKFDKCPALLNLLLAHAGIYDDCGLRMTMEEAYVDARSMNLSEFWDEIATHSETRSLLCECYVDRIQTSMGLTLADVDSDELDIPAAVDLENLDGFPGSVLAPATPVEEQPQEEDGTIIKETDPNPTEVADEQKIEKMETETTDAIASTDQQEVQNDEDSNTLKTGVNNTKEEEVEDDVQITKHIVEKNAVDIEPAACCSICPCFKKFESDIPCFPATLTRSLGSDDKVGQRIHQIAFILRNLSFEEDNASVMASSPAMLRYLLIASNCSYGTLAQLSFDILGNISTHIKLQDPHKDPITSMLLSLVTSGLFSVDRFKVLRSLETIRELTKTERNEKILGSFMETNIYKRLCELLTICDIMLLIYTLECLLSITGIGETVCNELVRIKGSVATLVSLVTVEAQSYGPKGCILMRVVETVTGAAGTQQQSQTSSIQTSMSQASPGSSQIKTIPSIQQQPGGIANSIQAIGLRTVSGHTIVPPVPVPTASPTPSGSFAGLVVAPYNSSGSSNIISHQSLRPLVRVPQSGNPPMSSSPPIQVQVARPTSSVSPSLVNHPASPNPALTQVAQIPGKPTTNTGASLPPSGIINSMSSTPVNSTTITNAHVPATTASSMSPFNNVNHVQSKSVGISGTGASPVGGGVAQVSSHSLTQQVYTPSTTQKESLTEEAWATAWLQGGFEATAGTSTEEGELYRMYCVARKKPHAALLSQDQLIQCVKLVYGASVGPVVKSFGSTSLSFIEGIRPKINLRPAGTEGAFAAILSTGNNAETNSHGTNSIEQLSSTGTNGIAAHTNSSNNTSTVPRPPTPVQQQHQSVHIPSPLSPILKATLSRPPTPKSTTGDKKSSIMKEKKSGTEKIIVKKKIKKESQQSLSKGTKLSPSSSAIRSLLASKVAQRQQKKLQETHNSEGNPVKMNGVEKGDESSASSSLNSIEEMDSCTPKTDPSTLTFEGVLCNGTGDPSKIEQHMEIAEDEMVEDITKNAKVKGMLVDLLERKVAHKDVMNGVVGREIRISEKGLELVDKQQPSGPASGNSSDSQEPLQMTFYASPPEVVPSGQNSCNVEVGTAPETVLLSGGGGNGKAPQVVKISKVMEQPSENATLGCGNNGDGNNSNSSSSAADLGVICGTNGANGASNDLLEKFNLFSDLIVVNPEQLGLKRPSSALTDNNNSTNDQAPPAKKAAICVNGTESLPSSSASHTPSTMISTPMTYSMAPAGTSVLQAALSLSQATTNTTATDSSNSLSTQPGKLSLSQNNVVHQMVRLVNPNNPNQMAFAPRQMVLQAGGHQVLLSSSQQSVGQVIISKPAGGGPGELAKAIILIPAPNQQQQQQNLNPGQNPLAQTVTSPNPVQIILNQMSNTRDGVPPSLLNNISIELVEQDLPYLCEWTGCGYRFNKHQQVFMHAISAHCPDPDSTEAVRCEWGANGCDPLLRKRYSVMTHLQDRHCNKQALELACYRRKNKIEPPPAPQQPIHHPGYAPNAAFHAIKRHALQFMNPKEVQDENEGPVTKSIRLTSALILRNLVNYSPLGRRMIAAYESQLSAVAMSNVESSRTIAQLLHDMSESTPNPNS